MLGSLVTYTGPPIDDPEILPRVPDELRGLLDKLNGFILLRGALHVRGACFEPAWHSLRSAWDGPNALHRLYPTVEPDDVPFGQDCLGDQFLLRHGQVLRLTGETGEVASLGVSASGFLDAAVAAPADFLMLEPLQVFEAEGKSLEPGQLINAFPPFCTVEAGQGVSFRAISVRERLSLLADLARQINGWK